MWQSPCGLSEHTGGGLWNTHTVQAAAIRFLRGGLSQQTCDGFGTSMGALCLYLPL